MIPNEIEAKGHEMDAETAIVDAISILLGQPADSVTVAFVQQSIQNCFLFARKQRDYGTMNISQAGQVGVLIRMNDKIQRLFNMKGKPAANESKFDSAQDLSIYGTILQLLMQGRWPGVREGWEL